MKAKKIHLKELFKSTFILNEATEVKIHKNKNYNINRQYLVKRQNKVINQLKTLLEKKDLLFTKLSQSTKELKELKGLNILTISHERQIAFGRLQIQNGNKKYHEIVENLTSKKLEWEEITSEIYDLDAKLARENDDIENNDREMAEFYQNGPTPDVSSSSEDNDDEDKPEKPHEMQNKKVESEMRTLTASRKKIIPGPRDCSFPSGDDNGLPDYESDESQGYLDRTENENMETD